MTVQAEVLKQCLQNPVCAARPALEYCLGNVIANPQIPKTRPMVVADLDAPAAVGSWPWRGALDAAAQETSGHYEIETA